MNQPILNQLSDLVMGGDEVLRTVQPSKRQEKRQEWMLKVRSFLTEVPEAENIGIRLTKNSIAADVGLLARYENYLRDQSNEQTSNDEPADVGVDGTRQITRDMIADDVRPANNGSHDDVLRIFISRKDEDRRTARGVKSALERYGAGRIEIYVAEDITSGSEWIEWIRERLSKADLFILIFTDDSQNWGWCLYEAGLFTNLSDIRGRPVTCIHNPDITPPEPLRHLQAVPARCNELKSFLSDIFTKPDLFGLTTPLNAALADQPDELERAAEEIEILVSRQAVEKKLLCDYLFLSLPDEGSTEIHPEAKVSGSQGAFEIFGLGKRDWTWKDVEKQAMEDADQRWLAEVKDAVPKAARGKVFRPIQATIVSRRDGKLYRPVLYRADTLADHSKTFKFIFTEEVTWHYGKIPTPVSILSTGLTMATRFRYEVLLPFQEMLLSSAPREKPESPAEAIVPEIMSIEMESASRGLLEEATLVNAFKGGDRSAIREMFGIWYEIRPSLLGETDPLPDERMKTLIEQLLDVNRTFIRLTTQRLSELMTNEE